MNGFERDFTIELRPFVKYRQNQNQTKQKIRTSNTNSSEARSVVNACCYATVIDRTRY